MVKQELLWNLLDKIKNEEQQTFELQKQYIDLFFVKYGVEYYGSEWNVIPEDKILLKTIDYAIKLEPKFLINLPKTKITYQNCVDAIRNSKYKTSSTIAIVRAIPEHFFDYDLCKECVLTKTILITKIPAKFITKKFLDDLLSSGVNCSEYNNYINGCISANECLNSNNKNVNLNINIEELNNIFTAKHIEILLSKNITTLEKLFSTYDTGFLGVIIGENSFYRNEIINTTKILKCKYLNVDPMIDEKSEEHVYYLMGNIGISNSKSNCFRRMDSCSIDDFFKLVRSGHAIKELRKLRGLGEKTINEIINRVEIIVEYHDKCNNNDFEEPKVELDDNDSNVVSSKDYLVYLNDELNSLIEQRDSLNEKIEVLLAKIQENNTKGKVSK